MYILNGEGKNALSTGQKINQKLAKDYRKRV
jgi:hypothetical protein